MPPPVLSTREVVRRRPVRRARGALHDLLAVRTHRLVHQVLRALRLRARHTLLVRFPPLPFCKASCCCFFGKALSLAGWNGRSQCNEGYYFNSSYFDYEFGTGVEGVSSWQYYNASAQTCGDTPTDSKPFTFGAQCLPRQINRVATISGGSNYEEALQRLQSNLAPFPDDAFAGQAPVLCTSSQTPVPEWIFVLGGLGIVAGLGIYGRKILIAMGVKMTKITPSRGFAIDISAAFVVVVGSRCRPATTTTHTHRARNLDLRIPH